MTALALLYRDPDDTDDRGDPDTLLDPRGLGEMGDSGEMGEVGEIGIGPSRCA